MLNRTLAISILVATAIFATGCGKDDSAPGSHGSDVTGAAGSAGGTDAADTYSSTHPGPTGPGNASARRRSKKASSKVDRDVRTALNRFSRAFLTRDAAALCEVYSSADRVALGGRGCRAALLRRLRDYQTFRVAVEEVRSTGKNTARAYTRVISKFPKGEIKQTPRRFEMRREHGQWRVFVGIANGPR